MRRLELGVPIAALAAALAAVLAATPLAAQRPAGEASVARADSCGRPAQLRLPPLGSGGLEPGRLAELAGQARPRPRLINDPWSDLSVELCTARPAAPLAALLEPATPVAAGPILLRLLPLDLQAAENSAYPRDRDNGAVWAGRGLSGAAHAAVAFRWGVVSGVLDPGVVFDQNRAFETVPVNQPGFSPWIDAGHPGIIDWPQRFGDASGERFDPGQSYIRVDAYGLTAGLSTENLRWGPALRYPLMLGYGAPGFPHAFIGTSRPVDLWIGHGELRAVWGRLTESKYFDHDPANDHRLLATLIATFEPRGLDGLYLGATSVYEQTIPAGGLSAGDYVRALLNHPVSRGTANKAGNGLASLFARWALPASGFEAYAEWGREDYGYTWDDLLKEPDHSQAYTLGFQKVTPWGRNWFRLAGELAHLEASNTLRSGRGVVTFYTHTQVPQGHTQEGQLLGAPIGPGSDAQYLSADLLTGWGASGIFVERARYDDDAYYASWVRFYGASGHDVELTGGLRQMLYFRGLTLRGELTYSRRENRNFLGLDGGNRDLRVEHNLGLRIGAAWTPWPALRSAPPAAAGEAAIAPARPPRTMP